MGKGHPENITYHDKNMEDVELLEYWGQCDIDGDGLLEECVITVANRKTVIRADFNPFPGGFKPFIRFSPIPVPGSYWGMSQLRPISGIQDALNDRTNQIADNISLKINGMFEVNRHSEVDPDDLVSSPGGAIMVDEIGRDVAQLHLDDIVPSAFMEIGRLEGKIQRSTGVYDYAAGNAPQRQEAATTVISLQQVAEIRFKTIAIHFERQVIRPMGNMILKMMRELMGPQRQIRILDRMALSDQGSNNMQFDQVTPQDIVNDPDIYAVGAAIDPGMSKQMQTDNLVKFMTLVTSSPQLMLNPMFGIDWSVILEELPYLLDLKLKRPLITPYNADLAYQEMQQDREMSDQMMAGMMSAEQQASLAPPPGGEGKGAPSRTKGELAKKNKKK